MDFNPFTQTCNRLVKKINELRESEQTVADDLSWYDILDPHGLTDELRRDEGTVDKLNLEIEALTTELQENAARLSEVLPSIGTLLNPMNWFAEDQAELRRRRDHLRECDKLKTAQKKSKIKDLDEVRVRIEKVASDLLRHQTFDVQSRRGELSTIRQRIADEQKNLTVVVDRMRRVDEALRPFIQQMQEFESRRRRVESDLDAAQNLDRRLSSEDNSYERAMIHEECERRFGEGRPGRIVGERRKELRQLERDYDKTKRRVEDIARKAARTIENIVIDGNNLCYEGQRFIGLAAIQSLLPLLSRTYSVTVVFDSVIRKRLNLEDASIVRRLGGHAKVHVVATRRLADETILDLASAHRCTYVLSNDRFGDFEDKLAVREDRVIRHEIVNGHIFVHDLNVTATFGQ